MAQPELSSLISMLKGYEAHFGHEAPPWAFRGLPIRVLAKMVTQALETDTPVAEWAEYWEREHAAHDHAA